jgi:choline dehydrogenase-like flavoprotein
VHGTVIAVSTLTPESRGKVSLRSAAPDAAPRIFHNYLQAEEDQRSMIAGLRAALEIGARPAMRKSSRATSTSRRPTATPICSHMPAGQPRRSTTRHRPAPSAPWWTANSRCSV